MGSLRRNMRITGKKKGYLTKHDKHHKNMKDATNIIKNYIIITITHTRLITKK